MADKDFKNRAVNGMENLETKNGFDPLDMANYRIEKLPKRSKSKVEAFLAALGGPLAIISFILIYFGDICFFHIIILVYC